MRTGIALMVVTLGVSVGCGQEVAVKNVAAKAADAFTGIWIPQSSIYDGKEQLPNKASREMMRLSIENGEYKLYYLTDPVNLMGRRLAVADFSVDEKAGTFELTIKDGIKKGTKLHGIYELGKSSMKICYAPAEKPRPTKFESPAGGETFYDTYERHKK